MNEKLDQQLKEILKMYKINILEDINASMRNINIDFENLEKELKNLLNNPEKQRDTNE
jgi:hypothetical protein